MGFEPPSSPRYCRKCGYDLRDTRVTDAGLVHLRGLSGLRFLSLRGTQVTDAGLMHLTGLTSLEWLGLSGTQVTDAGAAQLKQAMPQVHIKR